MYTTLYTNREAVRKIDLDSPSPSMALTPNERGAAVASLILRPGSSTFYIQHMVSGKAKRVSTGTNSLQIAKERLRQFESARHRGEDSPLPSRTPIATVVA